jgi:glycosyltransferase involved in cell wall biosynthesis
VKKSINLTIATDKDGQGGIATVLNVYESEGFFNDTNSELLVSHSTNTGFGMAGQLLNYLLCIIKLVSKLIIYDVGLVHIHMASRGSYARKSKLIKLIKYFNTRVILHLHGAEFRDFYKNECCVSKKAKIRSTFNSVDKVIVLSTQWLDWLDTILDDSKKGVVVYNAVPKLEIEKEKTNNFNFIFLGRLGERKGVSDLINAFKGVVKVHPKARLLLGGDGDIKKYQAMVEELEISEHVDLLGWVAGEKKINILKQADAYVLPSYNEGFPMGVLEAMSCNIPVIASTAGGIPDAITNKIDGLLIEPGDVESLKVAMNRLIEFPVETEKMRDAAKEKFLNNFSPRVIIPKLKCIYKELGAI